MSDTSTADPAVVEPPAPVDPALQPPPGYGHRPESDAPAVTTPEPGPEGWADPSSDPVGDEQAALDAAEAAHDDAPVADVGLASEPAADAGADPTDAPKTPANRGELEPQIKAVTDSYVTEAFSLEDGQVLTPHRIASEIERRRVAAGEKPEDVSVSAGAVTATLKRWQRYGFAVLSTGPLAFHEYTEDAMNLGLTALKERSREEAKERRKAAKVTATAAAATAPTESD